MQLTIDVKDSVLDKVLYILENLKSDVKIIDKTSSFDELSKTKLKKLNELSRKYKDGNKDDFEEYVL